MVTITKGVQTLDGKIPVTLLVDDVETANELIKLAKSANVPVVEQEDVLNKSTINPVFKHRIRLHLILINKMETLKYVFF
ncbi:hypothetical protein [Klebsiella pneumoniae]|uniref:hypothetical protein n=1 Tax=Klebsiella pneumoniae TaxID=573 RepID=UPI003890E14C